MVGRAPPPAPATIAKAVVTTVDYTATTSDYYLSGGPSIPAYFGDRWVELTVYRRPRLLDARRPSNDGPNARNQKSILA